MHSRPQFLQCFMLVIISLGFFLSNDVFAQHQAEFNFMGAFPQGEFKDQIDSGIGLSGGYTYGFSGIDHVRKLNFGFSAKICLLNFSKFFQTFHKSHLKDYS